MNTAAKVPAGVPSTEAPGGRRETGARSWKGKLPQFDMKHFLIAFLVLLNAVAMYGQAAWFRDNITNHNGWEDWIIPVGIALVVEMIGVYLSGMAQAALLADQSAGLLRAGSYAIGALAGTLNYWHFSGPTEWHPNASAITFGALSTISPWLWAIYTRHINRVRLEELGQVDKRGVKLSLNRKFWHPIKSIKVISYASWEGITNPDLAVRAWELNRPVKGSTGKDDPSPVSPAPVAGFTSRAERWEQIQYQRDINPGITQAEVAKLLGCSEKTVRNSIPEGVSWK